MLGVQEGAPTATPRDRKNENEDTTHHLQGSLIHSFVSVHRDAFISEHAGTSCNKYGDYQAKRNRGPEKGSKREDQGLVAMYYVHDFTVRGCRLEDSRSDGTHFFFCRRGQFNDNFVYRAKMGGYFIESCHHVVAANNIIETDQHQIAAIRVDTRTETLNIVIQGNLMIGDNRRILVEGSDQQAVTLNQNTGGKTERVTSDD